LRQRDQYMKLKFGIGVIVIVVAAFFFWPKKDDSPARILFIGNSYTFFNSSPEVLKALAKEAFPDRIIETKLISQGGMTLERHWQEGRALAAIESRKWDYVVLQEQSRLGMSVEIDDNTYFGNTAQFYEYARKFDTAIKAAGAKTVLFMTWSRRVRPQEQAILTHAYTSIANELDAILSPVGLAWDVVRSNDQIDLYYSDGSHPSVYGSYLVATSLFSTIFEESPIGLSGNITGLELSSRGEPGLNSVQLVNISSADAKQIQEASWRVNQPYYKTNHYSDVHEPALFYEIPQVKAEELLNEKVIEGSWYGTSTYSNSYLGVVLDIASTGNELKVELSLHSPDRQDRLGVSEIKIEDNNFLFSITDELRDIKSDMTFSLSNGELNGISYSSKDNITRYKHWNFSKNKLQNGTNLASVVTLQKTFQFNIRKQGYVKAALDYYKRYSKLIGEEYKPSQEYLMAMSSISKEQNRLIEAQGLLDLAAVLYPKASAPAPLPSGGTPPPPPPPGTGTLPPPPPPPPNTGGGNCLASLNPSNKLTCLNG